MIALEKERRNHGWSQRELMRRSGVDSAYISRAERQGMRLYPGQARKIADALGWEGDPAELFKEVEENE